MQYRSLGRTGVQVSVLTLGSMLFGNGTDAAQAASLVDRALDAGINALDTADVYTRGESERILGDLLRRSGRRDRIVLSSKGYVRMDDDPNAAGSSRRHIIEACNASLSRLDTDHLDVYYLHRPDTRVPIDETLRALDDLTRAGKIRYVGTSSFAAWQILESLWAAKEYRLERPVAEQAPYSLLDRRAERELLPMARSYGIGITVWSPLAGGMLTGKYRREGTAAQDTRLRPGEVNGWSERHFTEQAHTVVDTLVDLAKAKDATPAQIALAWTLTRPGISSLVLGARSLEQLDDQLGALTVELDSEDLAALDRVSPPGRAIAPYYLDDSFADWSPHQHRW